MFERGVKVAILPETFFSNVDKDQTLTTTFPNNFDNIDFLFAAFYYRNHWSLVLLDVKKQLIFYLDPIGTYVSISRQNQDLKILKNLIAFHILGKTFGSTCNWKVVTTNTFSKDYGYILKQTNGHDCGLFVIMYFLNLVQRSPFDFTQDDMPNIRFWLLSMLVGDVIENKVITNYRSWLQAQIACDKLGSLRFSSMVIIPSLLVVVVLL